MIYANKDETNHLFGHDITPKKKSQMLMFKFGQRACQRDAAPIAIVLKYNNKIHIIIGEN